MTLRLRFLPLALVAGALLVAACSGASACDDVQRFSTNPGWFGVNIAGYEAYACNATFTSGTRSVTTQIAARAPSTLDAPPSSPTMSDELACRGFSGTPDQCVFVTGPATRVGCARSTTCLSLTFTGADATYLASLLGPGATYDVQLECGGVILGASTDVSRVVQVCYL